MKAKLIIGVANMTVGRIYHVANNREGVFDLYDDHGQQRIVPTTCFEVVPEVNLPPMTGEYKEAVQRMLDNFNTKPITYKDFLASMPEDSYASVLFCRNDTIDIYAYDLEFACTTEERAEEVYAALITLFKDSQ